MRLSIVTSSSNFLAAEHATLKRLLYKHHNQHRRSQYYQRLRGVCKRVEPGSGVVSWVDGEVASGESGGATVSSTSHHDFLLSRRRRLRAAAPFLAELRTLCVRVAAELRELMGQSYFMGFALTGTAIAARLALVADVLLVDAARELEDVCDRLGGDGGLGIPDAVVACARASAVLLSRFGRSSVVVGGGSAVGDELSLSVALAKARGIDAWPPREGGEGGEGGGGGGEGARLAAAQVATAEAIGRQKEPLQTTAAEAAAARYRAACDMQDLEEEDLGETIARR